MNSIKQHWNGKTGRWESQTNQDFVQNMNRRDLAKFFANHFCHGYGEEQFYKWLGMEHKEDENN